MRADFIEILTFLDARIVELEKELTQLKTIRALIQEKGGFSSTNPASPNQSQNQSVYQNQVQNRSEAPTVQSRLTEPEPKSAAPQPQASHGARMSESDEPPEKYEISNKQTGSIIATASAYADRLEIVPHVEILRKPPFTTFFEDRVLNEMKQKDERLFQTGVIPPESIIDWTVQCDTDQRIKRVTVTGLDRDARTRDMRIKEIISAFRWTAERMMEKRAAELSSKL
ncbi:MAG: hypothetical protein QXS54_05235 [Candidatus Methanomethylicaceae archaeon]